MSDLHFVIGDATGLAASSTASSTRKQIDTRHHRTKYFEFLEKICQFYVDFFERRKVVASRGRLDSDTTETLP